MNVSELTKLNPYQLSHMGDIASPDSKTSVGAEWLERCRDMAAELLEEHGDGASYDDLMDRMHELADAAVPAYTHERWTVFADLALYNEDVEGYGVEGKDMTELAGIACYSAAYRLISTLVSEVVENR